MSDSGEPGVILYMQGGVLFHGIARNDGYSDPLPKGLAWFSVHKDTHDIKDIVVAIDMVLGIARG